MINVGPIVGEGRTSTVCAFGDDSVIKIPKSHVPDEWIHLEAAYTEAVRSVGAEAPEVRDLVEIEGRPSIVFERIHGLSMWDVIRSEPDRSEALVDELVGLQRRIHGLALPVGLPDLVARMQSKALAVIGLSSAEQSEAHDLIDELPRGAGVLHGDLHPGNIIVTDDRIVAIDWFDASIGHPLADVLRSTLLMRPFRVGDPVHLPNADEGTLEKLHGRYIELFADVLAIETPNWLAAVAVSRLAEAADPVESDLWDRWHARPQFA